MGKSIRILAFSIAVFSTSSSLFAFPTAIQRVSIASSLTRPDFVTAPKGDYNRLFYTEQRGQPSTTQGRIRVMDNTTWPPTLLGTAFLTVSGLATGNEQGLLGLAFDPNYLTNGIFYTYTSLTSPSARNVVTRYVNANPLANVHSDAVAPVEILSMPDPASNHNGGWIAFGLDGYLYIATGDGGGACDSTGPHAQDPNSLLGKILRIDPTAAGYNNPPSNPFVGINGADEVYYWGLRNPWRDSFDRLTGDLYIGDVGQDLREEVDFGPFGIGGLNYGWNVREGTHCSSESPSFCSSDCHTAGFVEPLTDYNQSGTSRQAVTGGYVYRGMGICDLRGTYFFADYASSEFWTIPAGVPNPPVTTHNELSGGFITSFGEDARGEMYICSYSSATNGVIYKIMPVGVPLIGDLNDDKLYTTADADLLALALIDPTAYSALFPSINPNATGDTNCDGLFDGGDIAGMVRRIIP